MGGILSGMGYSLLPRAWHGSWRAQSPSEFKRAAVLSGLLEIGICGFLVVHRFAEFLPMRAMQLDKASGGVLHFRNEGTQLYYSSILIVEYLFQPVTLLLLILLLDGFVRAVSAGFAHDVLPCLPLQVAEWSVRRVRRTMHQVKLPPLIADEVTQDGDCLCVESCRAKADWHSSATVSYRDCLTSWFRSAPETSSVLGCTG
jgi:hypothetical protein